MIDSPAICTIGCELAKTLFIFPFFLVNCYWIVHCIIAYELYAVSSTNPPPRPIIRNSFLTGVNPQASLHHPLRHPALLSPPLRLSRIICQPQQAYTEPQLT
jgi:hypothetical protein